MVDLEIDSFSSLNEPLNDVMLHWRNCSDTYIALRTDHFVNPTFRESNLSPSEQLVKGC